MRTRRHLSMNIAGVLRNFGKKSMHGLFDDENGKPVSNSQARKYLAECQAKGWKLIPVGDECEGFDHFGGGCPGHPIPEEAPAAEQ